MNRLMGVAMNGETTHSTIRVIDTHLLLVNTGSADGATASEPFGFLNDRF